MPQLPSPFRRHVARWCNGCNSGLCEGAKHKVVARGQIPCDVLFVGEAPGESEDVVGRPFVGPAGKLLDTIIARAMPTTIEIAEDGNTEIPCPLLRTAFTNLVMCIPRYQGGTKKAGEPMPEEIKSCMPRLLELIGIANPSLIVAVGSLARDWFERGVRDSIKLRRKMTVVHITHPAAILRSKANVAQKDFLVRRNTVTLQNAFEELLERSSNGHDDSYNGGEGDAINPPLVNNETNDAYYGDIPF